MFWDHRLRSFFLQIKAERSHAHDPEKTIVKITGKAPIYTSGGCFWKDYLFLLYIKMLAV